MYSIVVNSPCEALSFDNKAEASEAASITSLKAYPSQKNAVLKMKKKV